MVMALDFLKQTKPQPFRARGLDALPDDLRERVEVFDYHEETGEKAKWAISAPVKVIMVNLPVRARISPDYGFYRKVVAGLGAIIVFLLAFAVSLGLLHVYLAAFPALAVCSLGAIIGYAFGHLAAPAPFWMVRRIWHKDGSLELRPIVHTLLRGEPPLRMKDRTNGHREVVKVAGFDAPADDVFVPHVHRATTLYEDLKMRTERADMRAPRDTWDKIQLGAVGLLAGGLVLGLFFLVAVTTN